MPGSYRRSRSYIRPAAVRGASARVIQAMIRGYLWRRRNELARRRGLVSLRSARSLRSGRRPYMNNPAWLRRYGQNYRNVAARRNNPY